MGTDSGLHKTESHGRRPLSDDPNPLNGGSGVSMATEGNTGVLWRTDMRLPVLPVLILRVLYLRTKTTVQ